MITRRTRWTLPVLLLMLPALVAAEPPTTKPTTQQARTTRQFLRWVETPDGGGELQTAVATYANEAGQKVHLVGAVHVGDRAYYRGLQRLFAGYDALLYEMVKPRNAPAPKPGQRTGSLIGGMQIAMSEMLELAYQLDEIDYTRANFVHADMDYATFVRRQNARGESFTTLLLRAYLHEFRRMSSGKTNPDLQLAKLLDALRGPDRASKLKLLLGEQFNDIEPLLQGIEGPDGSVIISERNDAALSVMREQLNNGKRNIGIFYGAAHLKGMDKSLRKMGFRQTDLQWRTAWDIAPAPASTMPAQSK